MNYLFFKNHTFLYAADRAMVLGDDVIMIAVSLSPAIDDSHQLLPHDEQPAGWPTGLIYDAESNTWQIDIELQKLSFTHAASRVADDIRSQIARETSAMRRDGWISKALCAALLRATGDSKYLAPFNVEASIDGREPDVLVDATLDNMVTMASLNAGAEAFENLAKRLFDEASTEAELATARETLVDAATEFASTHGLEIHL